MSETLVEGRNFDDSDAQPVTLVNIDPQRDKRYRAGDDDNQPVVVDND